jgi:methylenetetrahydrofolate dehydrogenase (NADP+)/methenyltetrahydrofolate cyclohydrolase
MPEETAQDELERAITRLNDDPDTDGILIQLPLPKGHGLDENRAVQLVDPGKDVDGLHPVNVGLLHSGLDGFVPCTPIGIMQILKEMGCDIIQGYYFSKPVTAGEFEKFLIERRDQDKN